MAVTLNAKGSSYPSFTIGKEGVTLYQGTSVPSNSNGQAGDFYFYVNGSSSNVYQKQGSTWEPVTSGGGSGNVTGPLVSTDTAIARYNGTTGELIENSGVLIDSSNNITGLNNLTANGTLSGSNLSGTNTGDQAAGTGLTLTSGSFNIATTGISAGTYQGIVFNARGQATSATNENYTIGPVSSTTNTIPTFSDTTGTNLQDTAVAIDSNNTITISKDSATVRNSKYLLWNSTTNATPTQLFLDGASAQLVLQNNTTVRFRMQVVGRRTGTAGSSFVADYQGAITRDGSAATTALLGDITQDVETLPSNLNWTVAITADTTNGALKIQVTGDAATNILWGATVETIEITG